MDDESQNPQENELFVLRSMYGDDLDESYTASVWKAKTKKQPNDLKEFLIKIHPQGKERVSCGLYVKLPKNYPKVAPMLDIKNPVGLNAELVKSILNELRTQASQMLGGFMIAELVGICEDRINARNDQIVMGHNKSLAVEMNVRAKEDEQKRKRVEMESMERMREEDAHRKAALATQIEEREKAISERHKKHDELKSSSMAAEVSSDQGFRKETFDDSLVVNGVHLNVFRVSDPKIDGLGVTWAAEPAIADIADVPTLECFVVTFKSPFYSTTAGLRKLRDLEGEIRRLTHVSHEGLVKLYGVKLAERHAGLSRHWALSILRERTTGVSLSDVLHHCPSLGLDTSLNYLSQLTSALSSLHSYRVTHQDLTPDSVLLIKDPNNPESTIVKLREALYIKRLFDLHKSNPIQEHVDISVKQSYWPPPESLDKPLTYTFARDVWCLGVVWSQMMWGGVITKRFLNLDAVLLSGLGADIPRDLADLLRAMLNPTPTQRPRCQAIGEALAKRKHVPPSPQLSLKIDLGTPIWEKSRLGQSPEQNYFPLAVQTPGSISSVARPRSTPSRFKEEFEHLEHLGKGGFGSVDKVRMKLDHMIYAIKRIELKATDSESRILREVNALSQLNHRHIVRYITCWLEDEPLEDGAAGVHSDSSRSTDQPSNRPRRASAVEEDDDLFQIKDSDFDSDHEITRTQSFPSVIFAKDNNDGSSSDEESSSDDETSVEGGDERRLSKPVPQLSPKPKFQRVLYIQMEFVEQQTLKEAVAAGLDEERCWKLFRQVVDAMAHMFSLGIVHRDIKLTNILIDKMGDAKLGDFGLAQATTTLPTAELGRATRLQIGTGSSQASSGVGTFLYVAPEIRNPRPGPRDLFKADMFSLGIVFFEMVQGTFTTEQERYVVIQALREFMTFPSMWAQKVNQRKIVEWLLNHDPSRRPTPVELLHSGLLPERLETKRLEDALRLLVDKGGPHHQSLLARLFSQPQDPIRPFIYDRAEQVGYMSLQSVVEDHVKAVFHRRGAINMEPPLFLPAGPSDIDERAAVIYLDRQGNLVALPTDGFLPFARFVVRRGINRIKRYGFCQAFEQGIAGGQPRSIHHAMFDIVSLDHSLAAEGEAMAVVENIIRTMPALTEDQWDIHFSHGVILSCLYEAVPENQRVIVDQLLKNTLSSTHFFDRDELLEAGLPRVTVDELEVIVNLEGDLDVVFQQLPRRIQRALERPVAESYNTPIADLREVLRFVTLFGVTSRVIFSPRLTSYHDYFREGSMFEFSIRGKRKSVLATGGRYNYLVRRTSPPTEKSLPSVVGVQIELERIMQALWKYQGQTMKALTNNKLEEDRSFGLWAPRRADVYVCSFQPGKLAERIEIVNLLWSHGISADLMYESAVDDSLDKIMATCLKEGILYLVLTRAQATGSVLRVKSVLRKTEEQVPRSDLVGYLSHQLAEQKRVDLSVSEGKTAVTSSTSTGKVTVDRRDTKKPAMDLQLVLPVDDIRAAGKPDKDKGKGDKGQGKKRRAKEIFRDKADKLYTEIERALQAGVPVIAIAVPSATFARLTQETSWVTDDEAWRAVLPAFDKTEYANQIREAIAAKKADGHRFVWLLSVREEPRRAFMFHFPS